LVVDSHHCGLSRKERITRIFAFYVVISFIGLLAGAWRAIYIVSMLLAVYLAQLMVLVPSIAIAVLAFRRRAATSTAQLKARTMRT
jgi:ABC-type uncharacterized transport system permease subunit